MYERSDALKIAQQPISFFNPKDALIWRPYTSSGEFAVKKGLPLTESTTKQWNSKSHSSKPISLAVKSELHNRNTSLDLTCGFCREAHILEHLFWYYETPRLLWFASPITLKTDELLHLSLQQWFISLLQKQENYPDQWTLWSQPQIQTRHASCLYDLWTNAHCDVQQEGQLNRIIDSTTQS